MGYNYLYTKYDLALGKTLAAPIKVALFEKKMTVKELLKLLKNNGVNLNYDGFKSAMKGTNPYIKYLVYYSKIYFYLGLPEPSAEYLLKCTLRLEEIKTIKSVRAQENKKLKADRLERKNERMKKSLKK